MGSQGLDWLTWSDLLQSLSLGRKTMSLFGTINQPSSKHITHALSRPVPAAPEPRKPLSLSLSLDFRCLMGEIERRVYSQRGWRRARLLQIRVLYSSPSSAVERIFLFVYRPSSSFIFADVGSSCRLRFPTGRPPSTAPLLQAPEVHVQC